jgi:hypothetical protein
MAGDTRSYEFSRGLAKHGHKIDIHTADNDQHVDRSNSQWRVAVEDGVTVNWAGVPYKLSGAATCVQQLRKCSTASPRGGLSRSSMTAG